MQGKHPVQTESMVNCKVKVIILLSGQWHTIGEIQETLICWIILSGLCFYLLKLSRIDRIGDEKGDDWCCCFLWLSGQDMRRACCSSCGQGVKGCTRLMLSKCGPQIRCVDITWQLAKQTEAIEVVIIDWHAPVNFVHGEGD